MIDLPSPGDFSTPAGTTRPKTVDPNVPEGPDPSAMPEPRPFSATDYLATIAAELAAEIHPPNTVFAKFGLSEEESRVLLRKPTFQKMVRQASAEWKALDNTEKRVRYKALIAVEELMPDLFAIVTDTDNPASSRNETFKTFMKLANIDRTDPVPQGGSQFSITINLGEDQPPLAIEGVSQKTGDED